VSCALEMTSIDGTLSMLHGTSESAKLFGQSNITSSDQLVQQGQQQTAQMNNELMQKHLNELMAPTGNSTLDASKQIIKVLPAREIVVMPNSERDTGNCLEDSWWTRYPVPVPKFEKFSNTQALNSAKAISAKDVKDLGKIPDFHVRFDPSFGYRNFLS
jgi:hypothetical protein